MLGEEEETPEDDVDGVIDKPSQSKWVQSIYICVLYVSSTLPHSVPINGWTG